MGHAWYGNWRHTKRRNREHPVTALLAVVAILLAILLISFARVAVHGTQDLEATLLEPLTGEVAEPAPVEPADEVEAAVVTSRWATGLAP
jgi:hypothetical protein